MTDRIFQVTSRESQHSNLIFHDCAIDCERVVASIVALLFLIIAICKAQRFRFLALYLVFESRQHDLTSEHSSHDQS